MSESCKEVNINGQTYIRKDLCAHAKDDSGRPFVIIRSYGAGVFAGYLAARKDLLSGLSVILDGCIRLHRWTGCSLSQVANDGIAGSGENRFSQATNNHEVMGVIEVIPCTEKARKAIQGVETWQL